MPLTLIKSLSPVLSSIKVGMSRKVRGRHVIVVNMADAIVAANLKLPARDPLAGTALEFRVNLPAKTQCGDSRMKYAFLDAEVSKSPNHHISTDA